MTENAAKRLTELVTHDKLQLELFKQNHIAPRGYCHGKKKHIHIWYISNSDDSTERFCTRHDRVCLTSTFGSLKFLDLFYSKSFIIGFLFYVGPQNKTYQKTSKNSNVCPTYLKQCQRVGLLWHTFDILLSLLARITPFHTCTLLVQTPDIPVSLYCFTFRATRKSLGFKYLNKYNC